jgi:Kdo2-lipid IVA lauroyltransferase/acyltransferase
MILIHIASWLISRLSWRRAQRLGALFGMLWYHVVPIRRRVVMENLRLALPAIPDHRLIARAAYRHFGISLFELFKMSRMAPADIAGRVHPRGMEHFNTALARGKGVIVVTAHFGNFDLQAVSQAASGIPLAIVSRTLHAGGANRFWMETRKQSGLRIFSDKGAGKSILKWLRKGGVLGLTVDQRTSPANGGILVDFMGHPAWTTTSPAALALASGAALMPVKLERRADGDHDLLINEEIPVPDTRNAETTCRLTELINKTVSAWIAEKPDQWMWLHKRFRNY